MKKLVHVTKRRSVQLYLPLAPARPANAPPDMRPQPSISELKKVSVRLAGAATQFIRALWNLLVLWFVVPATGAGLYWMLDRFKFAYPGIGLLVGMSLATQLLHRGADSLYRPTGQGLLCYFGVVALGHGQEIFSGGSYAFENFVDVTLLARGEPITSYHWLGLVLLGFSSVVFDLRQFCSMSCPGHCLGGYRRRLHSAAGALEEVATSLLTVASCALALALKVAWVAFVKCKSRLSARKEAVAPPIAARSYAPEQVTVIEIDTAPAIKGELAAPVEAPEFLKQPASAEPVLISRQRNEAMSENSSNKNNQQTNA